jgi:hypothetical protein
MFSPIKELVLHSITHQSPPLVPHQLPYLVPIMNQECVIPPMMEQRQLFVEVGAIPNHFYEVMIYEFTKKFHGFQFGRACVNCFPSSIEELTC